MVRHFVGRISRSGIFSIMVGGLATVAGSVLVGYALVGADLDHLIAAAFMAAPGALAMAKIVVPETEKVDTDGMPISEGDDEGDAETAPDTITEAEEDTEEEPRNLIDAAAAGAADGLKLALNIGAMLLAFISLIALVNLIIGDIAGLSATPT
ncbi:MAG: nucleoside transporter C-terminal domain-containing protein [Dermatophilaceae bacterium]